MKPLKQIHPTLIINPLVYRKMRSLVDKSDKEIAWHGFMNKLDDTTFYWYDIILYPQYVTAASVDPDENEYQDWLIRQMEFDNFTDMRMHGHSHVRMACNPSGTDMTFRENILANVKDYYFFLITNKQNNYSFEIYDMNSRYCYETNDIEMIIGTPEDINKAINWSEKAIKNNLKERSLTCSTISNQLNSSIQNQYMKQTSMYLESGPSVDPFQKFWQEQE